MRTEQQLQPLEQSRTAKNIKLKEQLKLLKSINFSAIYSHNHKIIGVKHQINLMKEEIKFQLPFGRDGK